MDDAMDQGFATVVVLVQEISEDGTSALVVDQFGRMRDIPLAARRGKGPLPAVGETWILDKTIAQQFTFGTVIDAVPPVITGSNGNIPALQNLLAALDAMKLIVNETEDTDL